MALVFGIITFLLFFSIVVINTMCIQLEREDLQPIELKPPIITKSSACSFATGICLIKCSFALPQEIGDAVDSLAQQQQQCITDGVNLDLSFIEFNYELLPNWYTGEFPVTELRLYASLDTVHNYAFNSTGFRSMKKLKFDNIAYINSYNNAESLNGLESLESIHFIGGPVKYFGKDFLAPVRNTLKVIELDNISRYSTVTINGLSGTNGLLNVKQISYTYTNLKDSLTSISFIGTTGVTSLDLSNSKIEVIGKNTFDPISNTIKHLDLRKNSILTFPSKLFTPMILNRDNLKIYLEQNKLICNCELAEFQYYLINNIGFFGDSPICKEPSQFNNLRIADINQADICDDAYLPEITEVPTITTLATMTTSNLSPTDHTTSTINDSIYTTTPPTDNANVILNQCKSENSTVLQDTIKFFFGMDHKLTMEIDENGNILITVNLSLQNLNQYVIVWMPPTEYLRTSDIDNMALNCIDNLSSIMTLTNITTVGVHTFCLIEKDTTTITPFDCIPFFYGRRTLNVWLSNDVKTLSLTLVSFGFVIAIFFGAGLAYMLLRTNPMILRRKKCIETGNNRSNSDIIIIPNECTNRTGFNEFHTSSIRRRHSDNPSLASGNYETAFKRHSFREFSDEKSIYSNSPYSPAPPLPNDNQRDNNNVYILPQDMYLADQEHYYAKCLYDKS